MSLWAHILYNKIYQGVLCFICDDNSIVNMCVCEHIFYTMYSWNLWIIHAMYLKKKKSDAQATECELLDSPCDLHAADCELYWK